MGANIVIMLIVILLRGKTVRKENIMIGIDWGYVTPGEVEECYCRQSILMIMIYQNMFISFIKLRRFKETGC